MAKSIMASAAIVAIMLATAIEAHAQIATSCADCPTSEGVFTITNNTGLTLHYKVKWGNKGNWADAKEITLNSGSTERHSHTLDANRRAPTPYIHVDVDVTAAKEFENGKLEFGDVDHVGYPHPGTHGEPVHYSFFVGKDRKLGLARQ